MPENLKTTRASLLQRIKDPADNLAWREFHKLYAPLLYAYARARGLSSEDAKEVRDQCLSMVVRKVGGFQYDRSKGGFKYWLRRMVHNKVVDLLRRRHETKLESGTLRALPSPEPSPEDVWERTWQNEHFRYCVDSVRSSVSERAYQAFHLLLFEDCSVDEVCTRLEMNSNQVYKAKSQVLKLIREKLIQLDNPIVA